MWKDFFYYSKGERRAIYVLLVLIALLIIILVVIPDYHAHQQQAELRQDSPELKKWADDKGRKPLKEIEAGNEDIQAVLAPFDPNLADSIELSRLGLSKFVVRNILKYRLKGGRFTTPESLARIYGLTEEKFLELKPYIRISESFVRKPKKVWKEKNAPVVTHKRDSFPKVFKYPEGTKVNANLADTVELKKIPGIGSGIARMIVAYRERLGGFYSLEQLLEVKYMTPELLEWFSLGEVAVRRLQINRAGLEKLRSHPYLNFYQAKVIVEHRRTRGELKSLSQLSLYEEFTEKDLIRLAAYVSFD